MSAVQTLQRKACNLMGKVSGVTYFVLAIVVLGLFPLPSFWFTQANYIGVAALATLGLTLLTGVAGLTSFGQAAFVGIGAYTSAFLTVNWHLSPWLALPVAVAVTMLCASLIGVITLRLSGHFLSLATIAWALSLFYLFVNIETLGRSDGIIGVPMLEFGGFVFESTLSMFYLIWSILALAIAGSLNLLNSRPGRAIRALNGGVAMAESCGINTSRYKMVVFLTASLCAAIAGWLYALQQRGVNPTPFHLNAGIEYLFMAVIGGTGHVWGAIVGAIALTELKDVLQRILPRLLGQAGNAEIIVFGAFLIVLLQRSPLGLWPRLVKVFGLSTSNLSSLKERHLIDHTALEPLTHRTMPVRGSLLLELNNVRKNFGGLVAVNDLSFHVKAGDICALIGPNGAGKSTSFNLISRMLDVTSGSIKFNANLNEPSNSIEHLEARVVARRGIARTFQHVRLLPGMTVLDSVLIGAYSRGQAGSLRSVFKLNGPEEALLRAEALRQIERVGLGSLAHHEATSLALGQQRIVEIARALCCDPVLLLLDEPAAGLRHLEKQQLAQLLKQLREEGVTVLLVEHDMDFVMGLADQIVVMEYGTLIANGTPEFIRTHPDVISAYLGALV